MQIGIDLGATKIEYVVLDDNNSEIIRQREITPHNYKELLEKIDALKQRLITSFGYDEDSASDVLTYVGSIFARGDADEDED